MNLNDISLLLIPSQSSINTIVQRACQLIGNSDKKGGYFCVTDLKGSILLVMLIGEVAEEKIPRYSKVCIEKAQWLASHADHVSSWQSRNEAEDKWGGAIKTKDFIFSFSGLPEMWDEACMVAVAAHFITRDDIHKIDGISRCSAIYELLGSLFKSPPDMG